MKISLVFIFSITVINCYSQSKSKEKIDESELATYVFNRDSVIFHFSDWYSEAETIEKIIIM